MMTNAQIITATYNPTYFTAPYCSTPAVKCQTSTNAPSEGIDGVASFEVNSPNTIDDCSDDSNAIYNQDEYIMRMLIRNTDGLVLTGGTDARITTRVRTANDTSTRTSPYGNDVVQFWYASNANATQPIDWVYLTSKTRSTGTGKEGIVHTTVRLANEGGIQAIRVNYGYNIYYSDASSSCASADGLFDGGGASYIDVDDLVFYVEPGSPTASPTTLSPTTSSEPTLSSEPTMMPTLSTSEPTMMITSGDEEATTAPLPASLTNVTTTAPSLEPTLATTNGTNGTTPTQMPSLSNDDNTDDTLDDDDASIFERLLPFLPNSSTRQQTKSGYNQVLLIGSVTSIVLIISLL